MTKGELATLMEALSSLGDYIRELEQRVQKLGERAERITEHLRDEDVKLEVIRVGDPLKVASGILIEWIENAGRATDLPVVVKNITVEEDGTKTLIVEREREALAIILAVAATIAAAVGLLIWVVLRRFVEERERKGQRP